MVQGPETGLHGPSLPSWLERKASPEISNFEGRWVFLRKLSLLAFAALIVLACYFVPQQRMELAAGAALSAWLVFTAIESMVTRRLSKNSRDLAERDRWNQTLFERAGISLWREDWTAARDKVAALLAAGVTDIEDYFSKHPDEARALRQLVRIKDVHAASTTWFGAGKFSIPASRIFRHGACRRV